MIVEQSWAFINSSFDKDGGPGSGIIASHDDSGRRRRLADRSVVQEDRLRAGRRLRGAGLTLFRGRA